MAFPISPRQTYQGLETIVCLHGPKGVGFMTMQENLAPLSEVEPTDLETYYVTERWSGKKDPTAKVMRGQMSGHCYLTESAWTYVMAMKRRLLVELLLMIDTTDRM